jgi:hypothetical protein
MTSANRPSAPNKPSREIQRRSPEPVAYYASGVGHGLNGQRPHGSPLPVRWPPPRELI